LLGKLGERLLPLLLVVVAGLVLAVGIRGFRAEQPSTFRLNPFSTTPLVTEAPPPKIEEVDLADGSTLTLRPGTVAFDVARFLGGNEQLPQQFDLAGVALPLDSDDAASRQALRSLAMVLNAWRGVVIELRGNGRDVRQLMQVLEAEGVAAGRMTLEALPSPAGRAALLQPSLDGAVAAPVTLTLLQPQARAG